MFSYDVQYQPPLTNAFRLLNSGRPDRSNQVRTLPKGQKSDCIRLLASNSKYDVVTFFLAANNSSQKTRKF